MLRSNVVIFARVAYARAVAQDQSVLDHYFDLLEQTMLENEIISFPSRIFNIDESGFLLQGHKSCVIAEKGCKHPITVTTGDKAQITVIACINAMVIFDRKVLNADLTLDEVPETIYALIVKGVTRNLFYTEAGNKDCVQSAHEILSMPP